MTVLNDFEKYFRVYIITNMFLGTTIYIKKESFLQFYIFFKRDVISVCTVSDNNNKLKKLCGSEVVD